MTNAIRIFKFRNEVVESNLPEGISAYGERYRHWEVTRYGGTYGLSYRNPGEKLPSGSTPMYAFGGDACDYGTFSPEEVLAYVEMYGLQGTCVFEYEVYIDEDKEVVEAEETPIQYHVRLYSGDTRLPYHYDVVERDGKLVIPEEGGDEILVEQGVEFFAFPQGSKSCGMFQGRRWRAAVQESNEWVDFDHPIN